MGAGARGERVTVERLTRVGDGLGGGVETWTAIGGLWCDVKTVRASETERQGAVRTLSVCMFSADSKSVSARGVTTSDRLIWRSRAYNIRELRAAKSIAPDIDIIAETGA